MRKIPNFVRLRAFEAAARLESFTAAAQELHLTPSAISHQIRELEEGFGRPLFIRRSRRVEPTVEGRRLFASLSRAFDSMEAACNEVNLAPQKDVLAVHCAPSLAAKWLGPRLPQFLNNHSDVTIRLSTGAAFIDLSQAQEIDVVIVYGHAPELPGLDRIALGEESIAPLCAPQLGDSQLSHREHITTLPLIESQLSQVTWHDWFELNGLELPARPRLSFDRAALALSAAVDGMGVALETTRLAERELARGDLIALGTGDFETVSRETHFFIQRSNERQTNKVAVFREWLFKQAGI